MATGSGSDAVDVEGTLIPLPQRPADAPKSEWWEQFDLRSAFPSRAQGDQREKLAYTIVQDGSPAQRIPERRDNELLDALAEAIPFESARDRAVLSLAMKSEYWVRPVKLEFLTPYHAALPLRFRHNVKASSQYRMFRGNILPFLCWSGDGTDVELIERALNVFNQRDGFTLLDELLLETVDSVAPGEPSAALAERLVERSQNVLEHLAVQGAFCQASVDLFRRDLATVVEMKLPRRDLIEALTHVLSLHLTVHYYRVALVLGEEVDRTIAAAGALPDPGGGCMCSDLRKCTLAGRIKFRTGSTGYRPVSKRDPCALAYQELDTQRLLALPANIATANLAQHIWSHLGGPVSPRPLMRELADALRVDGALRQRFDAAASAFARLIVEQQRKDRVIARSRPGLHALREAILAAAGRNDLRHRGRDVVNQLAKRERGRLLHTNGSVVFFEIDEAFLALLVKLVCRDSALPLERFLEGLTAYGLAPQHEEERLRLTATLERLEMLRRYSDSGESTYVRYPD